MHWIGWIFFIVCSAGVFGEEASEKSKPPSDRLEVRTRFPRYRVYYDMQKTAQEVQQSLKEPSKEDPSKTLKSLKKD